jgi:Ca2+/Na+ antiporter
MSMVIVFLVLLFWVLSGGVKVWIHVHIFCFGGIYIFLTMKGEKVDYDNSRDCLSNHIDNNSD